MESSMEIIPPLRDSTTGTSVDYRYQSLSFPTWKGKNKEWQNSFICIADICLCMLVYETLKNLHVLSIAEIRFISIFFY